VPVERFYGATPKPGTKTVPAFETSATAETDEIGGIASLARLDRLDRLERDMKRIGILGALLTLVALTAHAGDGKDCAHSTQECLDYMATKMKNSGYVGVELEGIEEAPGNLVKRVLEGGPAEAAGVAAGDVLLAINDVQLVDENMEKVREIWITSVPGDRVVWAVARGSENLKLGITLGKMPADVLARYIGEHMLQHAQVELAATPSNN